MCVGTWISIYIFWFVVTLSILQVARGGQSVTMVGSRLIMFGGEDKHRLLLNDVHVLDLETLTWDVLETM